MTNPQIGDPITGLAQRIEKHEHDIQNIYGKLMRAFVGSRIVAGNITGVLPPGIDIGPTIVSMLNNSGGSLADGDVVVLDAAAARRIETTTTLGDAMVVGVVRDVNSVGTFANGSETPIQVDGYVTTLHVTGSVAAGDWLRTSTTVKFAISAGAVPSRGVFARALTADAAGAVEAYVFGGDMAALAQLATAKGDLLAATAAGILDNLPVSGNNGRVLTEDSTAAMGMSWQAAGGSLPTGGATGQALVKDSGADGDASWHDIEDLATAETDDTLVMAPDGAGGVEFRAEGAGAFGAWSSEAFNAANFTASAGNWTLTSPDQVHYDYKIVGKLMLINYFFNATTTSSTPASLSVVLPAGATCAKQVDVPFTGYDGTTIVNGLARATAGGTTISFFKNILASVNWTTQTNNIGVCGFMALEIQ